MTEERPTKTLKESKRGPGKEKEIPKTPWLDLIFDYRTLWAATLSSGSALLLAWNLKISLFSIALPLALPIAIPIFILTVGAIAFLQRSNLDQETKQILLMSGLFILGIISLYAVVLSPIGILAMVATAINLMGLAAVAVVGIMGIFTAAASAFTIINLLIKQEVPISKKETPATFTETHLGELGSIPEEPESEKAQIRLEEKIGEAKINSSPKNKQTREKIKKPTADVEKKLRPIKALLRKELKELYLIEQAALQKVNAAEINLRKITKKSETQSSESTELRTAKAELKTAAQEARMATQNLTAAIEKADAQIEALRESKGSTTSWEKIQSELIQKSVTRVSAQSPLPSLARRQESIPNKHSAKQGWIPAYAGMTPAVVADSTPPEHLLKHSSDGKHGKFSKTTGEATSTLEATAEEKRVPTKSTHKQSTSSQTNWDALMPELQNKTVNSFKPF